MTITANELKQWIQEGRAVQVADVRSPSEFATGHLPKSVNLPFDEIESRLDDVDDGRPLVLVCRTDRRARMALDLLQSRHAQLHVLEGGTAAWAGAGLPLVSARRTRWSMERQTRLGAGILVFTGVLLSLTVNPAWVYLAGFVSLGLMFAGLTDICLMGLALAKMPWNRPRPGEPALAPCAQAEASTP